MPRILYHMCVDFQWINWYLIWTQSYPINVFCKRLPALDNLCKSKIATSNLKVVSSIFLLVFKKKQKGTIVKRINVFYFTSKALFVLEKINI